MPPANSRVELTDMSTGQIKETDASSDSLLNNGIDNDTGEFEILIEESPNGKITGRIKKLEPIPAFSNLIDKKDEESFNDNGTGI